MKKQKQMLIDTLNAFNEACNSVSRIAWDRKMFNKDIREKFGIAAQLAVRVIEKVVETYKADGDVFHEFRDFGSIVYDQRVLSFKGMDTLTLRDSFPLGAENVNIRFILLQIWKQKKFSGSLMVGGFQER